MEAILPRLEPSPELLRRWREHHVLPPTEAAPGAGLAPEIAILKIENDLLLAKSTAVAFAAEEIGHYAVHLPANALASRGGAPKWFMAALLFPEGEARETEINSVLAQIQQACTSLGADWCEGQIEVVAGLRQPIIAGSMLAEAPAGRNLAPLPIAPHDRLVLSKGLAIAGTAMLGRLQGATLAQHFTADFAEHCRNFVIEPGLSVYPEARLAWEIPGVHVLREVAAGGLAHAIHEILDPENLGVEIAWPSISIFPETKLLCEDFGLDPVGLNASGALLLAGAEVACAEVLHRWRTAGIPAAEIGRILPAGEGRWLIDHDGRTKLPRFHHDEIMQTIAPTK